MFVTGVQRSGTTLIGRILAEHPAAAMTINGKLPYLFFHWVPEDAAECSVQHLRADEIVHALRRKPILGVPGDFIDSAVAPRIFEWAQRGAAGSFRTRQQLLASIREVCVEIYRLVNPRASIWGDKYNEYLLWLDRLRELYPRARIVMITRTASDSAESMLRAFRGRPWCPPTVDLALAKHSDWTREWQRVKNTMEPGAGFEISYEDLLDDPVAVLQGLARFLDIEPEPLERLANMVRRPLTRALAATPNG